MERTVEALLTGDMIMMFSDILDNYQTCAYNQAMEVLETLIHIGPNEPMAHVEASSFYFGERFARTRRRDLSSFIRLPEDVLQQQ